MNENFYNVFAYEYIMKLMKTRELVFQLNDNYYLIMLKLILGFY